MYDGFINKMVGRRDWKNVLAVGIDIFSKVLASTKTVAKKML